jgi:hypothetical protein
MKGFLVIVITAFALGWLGARARISKAKRTEDGWTFLPIRSVQFIYIATLLMGLSFILVGILGPQQDRTVGEIIGLVFAVLAVVSWPKAIEVNGRGLQQRSWCGRVRTMNWRDIVEVKTKRDDSIYLRGTTFKIVVSPYHSDRELFVMLLREHGIEFPSA